MKNSESVVVKQFLQGMDDKKRGDRLFVEGGNIFPGLNKISGSVEATVTPASVRT